MLRWRQNITSFNSRTCSHSIKRVIFIYLRKYLRNETQDNLHSNTIWWFPPLRLRHWNSHDGLSSARPFGAARTSCLGPEAPLPSQGAGQGGYNVSQLRFKISILSCKGSQVPWVDILDQFIIVYQLIFKYPSLIHKQENLIMQGPVYNHKGPCTGWLGLRTSAEIGGKPFTNAAKACHVRSYVLWKCSLETTKRWTKTKEDSKIFQVSYKCILYTCQYALPNM